MRIGVLIALACAGVLLSAQDEKTVHDRAVAAFQEGRFAASVEGFDELARRQPSRAPHLWQRGIAQYYAGRYADCRLQFESHRTVNPDDVENAVWHFLCVARQHDHRAARAALLPVGPDTRLPMRQVYLMFRGDMPAEMVVNAAGRDPAGLFYGHLYVGLYFDALGRKDLALSHLEIAAADRFASVGGYMHTVARLQRNIY